MTTVSERTVDQVTRDGPRRAEALKRLNSIPPFPPVARKLMGLMGTTANDALNWRSVSDILKSDAVLAGETLRLANSALFSMRHEVTSVLHAISVLGLDRLKSMVLTVGLRHVIRTRSLALQRCWRHNLASALVAEYAADACGLDAATAYTGALLHGIGQFALASCFPGAWDNILAEAREPGENGLLSIEMHHLGIDHVEAAAWLIHHWELPQAFLETSQCRHNRPVTIESADLRGLTELACEMADSLSFGISDQPCEWNPDAFLSRLPQDAAQRLQPTAGDLGEVVPYKINDFEMTFLR